MKLITLKPNGTWTGGTIYTVKQLELFLRDVRWSESHRPRVHGNGFIQLDLDEQHRLHVWGDHRIPRQRQPTPIHDHVFSFKSQVLRGRLINIKYVEGFHPGPIEAVNVQVGYFCEPQTRLLGEGLYEDTVLARCDPRDYCIFVDDVEVVRAGDSYEWSAHMLHESVAPEIAVSIIWKSGPTVAQGSLKKPRVFVPAGCQPDNDFNRYSCAPVGVLWEIVFDALKAA